MNSATVTCLLIAILTHADCDNPEFPTTDLTSELDADATNY